MDGWGRGMPCERQRVQRVYRVLFFLVDKSLGVVGKKSFQFLFKIPQSGREKRSIYEFIFGFLLSFFQVFKSFLIIFFFQARLPPHIVYVFSKTQPFHLVNSL